MRENSGYSLPTVLVIVFLITTLLYGVLAGLFFQNILTVKSLNTAKSKLNCISEVNQYLSSPRGFHTVTNEKRGINLTLKAIGKNQRDSIAGHFIYGIKADSLFSNALTITRPNFRGAVTGNTKIIGNILLTRNRINKGNIYGVSPVSKNYLEGRIIEDKNLNANLFNDSIYLSLFEKYKPGFGSRMDNMEIDLSTTTVLPERRYINNNLIISGKSFKESGVDGLYLHVGGNVKFLKGTKSDSFITIISDSTIVIEGNCKIRNAVLISRDRIIVKPNSHFKNTELISAKEIFIKNSQFNYPSVLALYTEVEDSTKLENKISIEESVINGSIILSCSILGLPSNKSKIFIDDRSKIQGVIYSENNSELLGEIFGSVYTYNLLYTTKEKEYINWLVNLNIDRSKLDPDFLLPTILGSDNKYELLSSYWTK